MIKFTGNLNRSAYWKYILSAMLGLSLVSGSLLRLFDIQDAEMPGSSQLNFILAVTFFALFVISVVYFGILAISAIIRRSRDMGHFKRWIVVGLVAPFGFIILGLIRSRN